MKNTNDIEKPNYTNIAKNLVFLDGITRCGKSIFSSVISSFEDMEHIQFMNQLEMIIPAVSLDGIKREYAKNILRISLNELAYNIQLSRNINYREKDQTGIQNYKKPEIYMDRLNVDEGDNIVNLILNNDIHIPFQTHDLMVNLDVVDAMELDCKIIELYRNPIDNIYSWSTRGWGERFGRDPRSFTLLFDHDGELFPWYCSGYEQKIAVLNPHEKCVMMGVDLIKRSIDQQNNAKHSKKIMTVLFEDMVQSPSEQLKRIERFLGKNKTKYTDKFVTDARCPRVLDPKDRKNKLAVLKENVNSDLFDELVVLAESYERDAYGLL
jgi:hypothetical protein